MVGKEIGIKRELEWLCWAISKALLTGIAEYQVLFAGLGKALLQLIVASSLLSVSIYLRLTRVALYCFSAHNFFEGFSCLQTPRITGYRGHGGRKYSRRGQECSHYS